MIKTATLSTLLLTYLMSYGQQENYCPSKGCSFAIDDPVHFDPYYNHHLCENFNPQQADFSNEYLELRTAYFSKAMTEISSELNSFSFNLDSLLNTGLDNQNGVIGLMNRRIRIHIDETELSNNGKQSFIIHGKSNVDGNICDFSGNINFIKAYQPDPRDDSPGDIILFAEYAFFEDSTQKHSGYFKGSFECGARLDPTDSTLVLDERFSTADGYSNRTYVGTWTSYSTGNSKKCIWGDYRLPFTFDFDCGDGEMHVCEEYVKNGWESFNQGNDYSYKYGEHRLKDQWWLEQE